MIANDTALLDTLRERLAALTTSRAEVGVLEDTAPRSRSLTAKELERARDIAMGGGPLSGRVPYPDQIAAAQNVSKTTIDDETNASIGARHEFGSASGKLPRRSFLKDPLLIAGQEAMLEAGVDEAVGAFLMGDSTRDTVMEKLAEGAELAIDGAFDTGGYGTWEPLAPSTIAAKGHPEILVESFQLRESVTHRITKA